MVDGHLPDGEVGSWVAAWDWLMRRLNERRDALRRQLGGALLFAVHPNWKPRVREAAPDFWSVRSLVLDLPGEKSVPSTRDPTFLAMTAEVDDGVGGCVERCGRLGRCGSARGPACARSAIAGP